jgi:Cyclin, N-terminal domain/Cyclin, C-terminal domain
MLKLTMCPKKRAKKLRAIPDRLRLPSSSPFMDVDEPDFGDDNRALLADNLQALLRQEQSGKYDCCDYLNASYWQQQSQVLKRAKFGPNRPVAGVASPSSTRIDEYCREQIVEWSFRVVDYFRIDREVVSVSMSYLDRYLSCCRCDRSTFKLAATATLYLAVKILYPCKLADLGILSDLSRGEFEMMDVCQTERSILDTLGWNLHPPTATSFFSIFLDYFFAVRIVTISNADMDDIYDVAGFFCELSSCAYSFTKIKESAIALAAILNALEGIFGPDNRLGPEIVHTAVIVRLVPHHHDLTSLRNGLWDLYERSEECAIHHDKFSDDQDPAMAWQPSIFVKKTSSVSSPPSRATPRLSSVVEFHSVKPPAGTKAGETRQPCPFKTSMTKKPLCFSTLAR